MKLFHPVLPENISFNENVINVLVIEKPEDFYKMVNDLRLQSEGGEGEWIFSQKGEIRSLQKESDIVLEPLSIELNQKKMVVRLHEIMNEELLLSELQLEWSDINAKIQCLVSDISKEVNFDVIYKDKVNFMEILKILNFKFEQNSIGLLEKIMEYILLSRELLKYSLFVFLNLKSYLSEKEIKELYKFVLYEKIDLLLIENHEGDDKIEEEHKIILDKDRCIIYS